MTRPGKYSPTRFYILLALLLGFEGCDKSGQDADTTGSTEIEYESVKDKSSLASIYELEHMKEWYPERILPPAFDYTLDLSEKSIMELWLLRNEIFARNGYLFDDAVLRGHFNQFKWYQPVFDVPDFKVQLDKEEQAFVNRVLSLEQNLRKTRYNEVEGYDMINVKHMYNRVQFKDLPAKLEEKLARINFAIVPAQHEQLFHVYDINHYEYIPSFITTDIYLEVLHKHFSSLLRRVEETRFIPLLDRLLETCYNESKAFEAHANGEQLKRSARWTTTYLALAYTTLTGRFLNVSEAIRADCAEEIEKIMRGSDVGSSFLEDDFFTYSSFVPRGNYTKSPELENYFRGIKWLNTAPLYLDNDERLLSAVLLASFIKRSEASLEAFTTFNEAIRFIAGDEDNLSLTNVIGSITDQEAKDPSAFDNRDKLEALRQKLLKLNHDKIRPLAGSSEAGSSLSRPSILFTAGRYTFDAEIMSHLVHVLQPAPRRPFPKGLDVFAALGNEEAERILIKENKEGEQWNGYPKALVEMQQRFVSYDDWNQNLYSKTVEAIHSLSLTDERYPLAMKTSHWQRKNLNTALAAWTELKHDMLLYAEQPYAAQAGQGGGPPPPQHIGYVEPNIAFWTKALELIDLQEKVFEQQGLLDENIKDINDKLRKIGNFLLLVSNKELKGETLTAQEFDEISWLGGRIEYLTFEIFGSDHLPEKERLVALAADVYQYNNTYLEEATGLIDEIYVLVEINGKPYLTRGAVFSYYEFTNPQPLTDELWQQQLLSGKAPPRPTWMTNLIVNTPSLESKPQYSLLGTHFY